MRSYSRVEGVVSQFVNATDLFSVTPRCISFKLHIHFPVMPFKKLLIFRFLIYVVREHFACIYVSKYVCMYVCHVRA